MNLDAARAEFATRLYRWALEEWDRELSQGFPLLRLVKGNAAKKTLDLLASAPLTHRRSLARALTKRFHAEAAERLGEPLSVEEASLLARCDAMRLEARGLRRASPGEVTFPRRDLAAILKRELSFLGGAESLGSYAEWRHITPLENWQLGTYLDVGGRSGDCSYFHTIETSSGTSLFRYLSLLSWLGISSESKWRVVQESDAAEAAAGMAQLCRYLHAVAPRLLKGLAVDT